MSEDLSRIILGPNHVAIDAVGLGYLDESGVSIELAPETDELRVDQQLDPICDLVKGRKGSISFKAVELTNEQFRKAMGLSADSGTSISVPIAGDDYGLAYPSIIGVSIVERWGLDAAGAVRHYVLGGAPIGGLKLEFKRGVPFAPEIKFDIRPLASSRPDGWYRIYDAVSGALTATITAGSGNHAVQFNKPMSSTALRAYNYSQSTGAITSVAFATTTVYGITIIDPTKIIVTGSGTTPVLTVNAGITAADGTVLAANVVESS
jgi:hypothetical protein